MPFYQKRGEIPTKRHIQFRDNDNKLFWEELISREGFSNIYSNVYHKNPPTSIEGMGDFSEIKKLSMNVVQTSSMRVFATPLARRLAREKGIDLGSVTGSGPHGRIVKTDILNLKVSDVDTNQESLAKSVLRTNVQQASGSSITNLYADRQYTEIPLNSMRKTVAARLTEAKQNIPHFYLRKEINIDELLKVRSRMNEHLAEKNNKLSINDFKRFSLYGH